MTNHVFTILLLIFMASFINWGIIGPGKIAARFASSFGSISDAKLYAVASRNIEKAKEFAVTYGIPHCYSSYEQLVNDPNIDVIYIATPHTLHHEHTLLCLHHKKAVLCEKPLTLNGKLALEMITAARQQNTFLMEAMWTRFFPATIKVLELIKEGAIGEVKNLRADFGFNAPFDPESRLYNRNLGGGSWLDVGVYPLFLALLILGKPDEIKSMAHLATTGADEMTNALLYYANGSIASIHSSIVANTPKTAEIIGTKGAITLHSPWYKASAITLENENGELKTFSLPYDGTGFEFQIREVVTCLQNSQKESRLMPLDFSLMMAETSDKVRNQCGINYAND